MPETIAKISADELETEVERIAGDDAESDPTAEVASVDGLDPDIWVFEVADALTTVSNPIRPRKRPPEKMRIGPLAVPLGVIAWSGSFLLHGGIVAAAVLIAFAGLKLPPLIAFARGDGSSELGIRNDATGVEQTPFAIPALTRADEVQVAKSIEDPNPDEPPVDATFEPTSGAAQPTLGALPIEHEADEELIGLAPATGAPMMRGHSRFAQLAAAVAAESDAEPSNASGAEAVTASPAITTNSAAPIGHGGTPSNRGTPGVANGIDSRGIAFPVYPPESLRRKEQGTVVLSVELDAKGQVVSINVLKDAGHPRLVQAAIDAIRATTFPPASEDGEAIASITTIPFRFSLR